MHPFALTWTGWETTRVVSHPVHVSAKHFYRPFHLHPFKCCSIRSQVCVIMYPGSVLPLVSQDTPPQALGPPYACTQAFKLDNLAMVDKDIDLRSIILDIPGKDLWISGLEHHLLQPQCTNNFGCRIGTPRFHIFGDALGLNHDHISPCVQKSPGLPNSPIHIARAL